MMLTGIVKKTNYTNKTRVKTIITEKTMIATV